MVLGRNPAKFGGTVERLKFWPLPPPPKDSSSFLGWGMRIAIVQGFFFGWVGGGGGGTLEEAQINQANKLLEVYMDLKAD